MNFLAIAALAAPSLRPGIDPISGQPLTIVHEAPDFEMPAWHYVARAGGRHAGRLLGEEFVQDMVDNIEHHLGRRLQTEGRTCREDYCTSVMNDCCTAPILERQTCANDWENVALTSSDDRQRLCGITASVNNAYTCCEPGPPWGLIIFLIVLGVLLLGTIIGIVLCCMYCSCCKECCPECCGSPAPRPTMNPGVTMQQGVAMVPVSPVMGQPMVQPMAQPGMNFDPVTGQRLAQPGAQPVANFDPVTGQPIQPVNMV